MMWWFLILAFGAVAVLWVGAALYLRVRRHMKPGSEPRETNDHEH